MEKRGSIDFVWTEGTCPATPPEGFEDYFGAGPLWRFIEYDGGAAFDVVDSIRDFPEGSNAEETMRLLFGPNPSCLVESVQNAMQRLLSIIDADPEIEVSYSVSVDGFVASLCLFRWLINSFVQF